MKYALGIATVLAGAMLLSVHAAPQTAPAPASAPRLEPFTNLPPAASRPGADKSANRIYAGTAGLALVAPPSSTGRTTIALLGDLSPGGTDRDAFLKLAVDEINLLHPEAVLTTGNLSPGLTRLGTRYAADANATRAQLDRLQMPWLPCVGESDVFSGTRLTGTPGMPDGDRRFEELYRRYVGPLYFSVDIGAADGAGNGGVHAIVLNSEEGVGAGNTISDAQIQWLAQDLKRTFDASRVQWVIVLVHRPLWRQESPAANPSNWSKIHNLLVEFNQRPTATIEGFGSEARPPRVAAVFAGGERAYALEPERNGIQYFVLGPAAALPREGYSTAEAPRHFTLLKFDNNDMHAALVRLDAGAAGVVGAAVLPADVVTSTERLALDAIAARAGQIARIEGTTDERGEPLGRRLTFHMKNPLADPIAIQLQMPPGSNWDFATPPLQRRLAPGTDVAYEFALRRIRAGADRPAVQATIRWTDPRGREHEMLLPLPVAVSPAIEIVSEKTVPLEANEGWNIPNAGLATAWLPRGDEPAAADPAITLRADDERLFIRVRVEDAVQTYWPAMQLAPRFGGLASDAISVSFSKGDAVQRLWLLPFAPQGSELWSNTGLGDGATPLQRMDPKSGIQSTVRRDEKGYVATLALPRKLLLDSAATQPQSIPAISLNVAVHNNNESAKTWIKSWTQEETGPAAWARITITQPPSSAPANHSP